MSDIAYQRFLNLKSIIINMCTIGFLNIGGHRYLFKNRDKTLPKKEIIKKIGNLLGVIDTNSDYLAWGLNSKGVAFVTSEVLGEGGESRTIPSTVISSIFHTFKDSSEVVEYLKSQKINFLPYNMIISDSSNTCILEFLDRTIQVDYINKSFCKTNHFAKINYGPEKHEDSLSTFVRLVRCKELIDKAVSIEDLKNLLSDHKHPNPENNICRHGIYSTISSVIIDVTSKRVLYAKKSPCIGNFKEFKFST